MLDHYLLLNNKPKNKFLRYLIILFYYSITSFILFVLIFGMSGCKKIVEPDYSLTLRLKPEQKINYAIEMNSTMISHGVLEQGWNDIILNNLAGEYYVYYWNEKQYTQYQIIDNYETQNNKIITTEIKVDQKKGNVSIIVSPLISNHTDYFLILNATNLVKKISLCFYWTVSIIDVSLEDEAICDFWTNSTKEGNLTNGNYYCDDQIINCQKIYHDTCSNPKIEKLEGYDKCYYTGITLDNSNVTIPLKIETMGYYDEYDYLEISVYDMDLSSEKRVFGRRGYKLNQRLITRSQK